MKTFIFGAALILASTSNASALTGILTAPDGHLEQYAIKTSPGSVFSGQVLPLSCGAGAPLPRTLPAGTSVILGDLLHIDHVYGYAISRKPEHWRVTVSQQTLAPR